MSSKLGEVFEAVREYAEAENDYEQQIKETEATVLEFSRMEAEGTAGELVREYLQVELMSLEEVLQRLADKGRELASEIRKVYSLHPVPYSKGESK